MILNYFYLFIFSWFHDIIYCDATIKIDHSHLNVLFFGDFFLLIFSFAVVAYDDSDALNLHSEASIKCASHSHSHCNAFFLLDYNHFSFKNINMHLFVPFNWHVYENDQFMRRCVIDRWSRRWHWKFIILFNQSETVSHRRISTTIPLASFSNVNYIFLTTIEHFLVASTVILQ